MAQSVMVTMRHRFLRCFERLKAWSQSVTTQSGVGSYIVGVSKAMGAKVITSASKDDAIKLLKDTLKADHVLNHAKQDIVEEVLKLTNGKGADIVYDATYSESSFDKSIQTVAEGGHWIVLGSQFANEDSKEAKALAKRKASVIHADMAKYSINPEYVAKVKSFYGGALKHATEWVEQGKLHPITQTIKLEQVQETLALVAKGKTGTGKVVAIIHQ
ncbi:unnamed protein product [Didymodactylos carnosus]|uniref:Alcohol dehydrogenase-like C-terminal domain-containing protein n=1 Tax=Didymodactylos carnosus TaxID=1234261 RepID=A0A814YHA1_9BILA|nr:unnamed protein product [Didymodactylos carnosus]CAF1230649.1 unnamed protein product [Didymodactylos carnosus]CAF3844132.1 unnamed protein product [Didymodactylos carnosus]CAF3993348.1 unnamed protein product [Didymodactylos carnosus]